MTDTLEDQLRGHQYIGDGVYAYDDGYTIWLRTSNGISVTNTIALEPEVYRCLLAVARRMNP